MFEKFNDFVAEMGRAFPDVEPIERAALLICAGLLVVAERLDAMHAHRLEESGR
jgi:hypothetical protein